MREATEQSAAVGASLSLELVTLEHAVRGAQVLVDTQIRHGYLDGETEQNAPRYASAILALLGARLQHLQRVLRGEEDPLHLCDSHNAVELAASLDSPDDMPLIPWCFRGGAAQERQVSPGATRRGERKTGPESAKEPQAPREPGATPAA